MSADFFFHSLQQVLAPLQALDLGDLSADDADSFQQLEQLFTLTPTLLCIAGADGYFRRINPAFSQLLGHGADQLLTRPILEFVHPDDRAATQAELQRLGAGATTIAFENRYRCGDGSYRWLSWHVVAHGADTLYAAAYDVTAAKGTAQRLEQEIQERIGTEAALRESQQKLHDILDIADEAIISIDGCQRIVMYNQGAEQMFGYSSAEVLGQPLDLLLPEAFRQEHRQHVQRFAGGGAASRSMAYRSRDVFGRRQGGEEFPAEASISKLDTQAGPLFTVMLRDVTDNRRAEEALRRREAQLRLITDALPVLICYLDPQQRYRFSNRTYGEWFRLSPHDIHRRSVADVMGAAYYESARVPIQQALAGHTVQFESELEADPRYLRSTYLPDFDEQGAVRGAFGLISDISDRKATERLKDEFVSIVSHELRTPLTAIHGSLKLLATQRLGQLSDSGQEMVAIALRNTERLTRLISDVLDLQRMELGQMPLTLQPCSAAELMLHSSQAFRSLASEKSIHLQVEPLAATVWADPDRITQTLTNLLSNALKFSPPHTTVRLSATATEQQVCFQVADQGRGIPPDRLESIFERFQQVDSSDSRQRGGTGLGLAICKNIIQRHQGRIWAESRLGEGSCFYFTLPRPPQSL